MRIVGIIFFGFIAVCSAMGLIVFASLYFAFANTDMLFKSYKANGVYSKISGEIQNQLLRVEDADQGAEAEGQQAQLERMMQQKIAEVFFSEESVQRTIETNILRFKSYQNANQKAFSLYLPFQEKGTSNTFLEELGLGEMKNDPQVQQMLSQIPSNMVGNNGALNSVSEGAKNLKLFITVLKYTLPGIFVVSVVLFLLLGRGIGRLRNLGVLFMVISVLAWGGYILNRVVLASTIQNPAFTGQNLGTEIVSELIGPIAMFSMSLAMRIALFVTIAGVSFVVAWIIARAAFKPTPVKKVVQHKKSA